MTADNSTSNNVKSDEKKMFDGISSLCAHDIHIGKLEIFAKVGLEEIEVKVTGTEKEEKGVKIAKENGVLTITVEDPDGNNEDCVIIKNVSGQVAIGKNIIQSSRSVKVSGGCHQSVICTGNSNVGNISQSVGGISCGGNVFIGSSSRKSPLRIRVWLPSYIPIQIKNVLGVYVGNFDEVNIDTDGTATVSEVARLSLKVKDGGCVTVGKVTERMDVKVSDGSDASIEDGDVCFATLRASDGAAIEYCGTMRGDMHLKASDSGRIVVKEVVGCPDIKQKDGGRVTIHKRKTQ